MKTIGQSARYSYIVILLLGMVSCGPDPSPLLAPTVVTEDVGLIHDDDAHATGIIESDGGAPITQHGFVWSTSESPTIQSVTLTKEGAGSTGLFFGDIEGLTSKTKYYLRAYATNEVGTAYGQDITFTTDSKPAKIIVTEQINTVTIFDKHAILVTVKNDGEKTAYNISVKINALSGGTIVDTGTAFPANLSDILPGQSAQDDAIFFDVTPAQAATLTFSTPVITWLEKD